MWRVKCLRLSLWESWGKGDWRNKSLLSVWTPTTLPGDLVLSSLVATCSDGSQHMCRKWEIQSWKLPVTLSCFALALAWHLIDGDFVLTFLSKRSAPVTLQKQRACCALGLLSHQGQLCSSLNCSLYRLRCRLRSNTQMFKPRPRVSPRLVICKARL